MEYFYNFFIFGNDYLWIKYSWDFFIVFYFMCKLLMRNNEIFSLDVFLYYFYLYYLIV